MIINGNIDLSFCYNLKSLSKLKKIKKNVYLRSSGITKEYMKENYPQFLNKCNWGL